MSHLSFVHLNHGWNAEPNAPNLKIDVDGSTVRLSFYLNPFAYEAEEEEVGLLTFSGCSRWRWDSTNDEAWFAGQGRFATQAPRWGEFYEVIGDQRLSYDWEMISPDSDLARQFLFYFRDETIECVALDWSLDRKRPDEPTAV